MSCWSLREAQAAVGGELVGDGSLAPAALSMDTRTIRPGECFIAIRGQRDAHAFAGQAVAKGASALVVDHELPFPVAAADRPGYPGGAAALGPGAAGGVPAPGGAGHHRVRGQDLHQGIAGRRHRRLEDPGQPQQHLRSAGGPGHPAGGPGYGGAGDGHEHAGRDPPAHRDRPAGFRPDHQHRQRAHGILRRRPGGHRPGQGRAGRGAAGGRPLGAPGRRPLVPVGGVATLGPGPGGAGGAGLGLRLGG